MDLSHLAEMVDRMRQDLRKQSRDDKGKKKDKEGKRRKDKGGRHRRRSRDRRRNSSSSSRGGRSRRSSSGTSSETSDYVHWRAEGRNKAIRAKQITRMATRRFKDQSEVLAFAAQHPGALTAAFLQMVRQRTSQIMMSNTRELRNVSLVDWAQHHLQLTEMRDQKEIMTLCLAMDNINARKLEAAMDVLSQRIAAVQAAKSKGGSWEKAAKMELTLPPGAPTTSSGLLRLTQ